MIKLEIKDYCHDCIGFEADVEGPHILFGRGNKIVDYTDTIIRCEHRKRCANAVNYVMEGYKKEKENVQEI